MPARWASRVYGQYLFDNMFGAIFSETAPNYRVTVTPSATYPVQSYDATPPTNDNQWTLRLASNVFDLSQDFGYSALTPTIAGLTASPAAVCAGSPVAFTATVGSYAYILTNGSSTTTRRRLAKYPFAPERKGISVLSPVTACIRPGAVQA